MEDFLGRGDRRLSKARPPLPRSALVRRLCTPLPPHARQSIAASLGLGALAADNRRRLILLCGFRFRFPAGAQVIRRAWERGACNEAWWEGTNQAFAAWDEAIGDSGMTWKYRQASALQR